MQLPGLHSPLIAVRLPRTCRSTRSARWNGPGHLPQCQCHIRPLLFPTVTLFIPCPRNTPQSRNASVPFSTSNPLKPSIPSTTSCSRFPLIFLSAIPYYTTINAYRLLKMGLFSKKKKDADSNPYAQDAGQAPYANPLTPYQQARNDMAQGRVGGLPSNPRMGSVASNTPPPSYKSPAMSSTSNRFGDDKYGSQNGYGADRYGNNTASPAPSGTSGGYGGFDDSAGKSDLFGNASGRYVPPQPDNAIQGSPAAPAGRFDNNRNPALFGNAENRYNPYATQANPQSGGAEDEYGGYGAPRELTAEEQEEQEVQAIKDETKAVRKEGISSLDRTLATGNQAMTTMFGTRLRLAEQEERLHNTEMKLDLADIHTKDGSEKTKELDKLNSTPFFIPVGPGKKARTKQVEATMERHREERERREQTRKDGFQMNQRMEETTKELYRDQPRQLLGTSSKVDRSKFNYEEDEEDIEDEETIGSKLELVQEMAGTLKLGAKLVGEDLDRSNARLARIGEKTEVVDDRVRMNRARLNQIR